MSVYKAINQIQAELVKEGITKDRKNAMQGYNFRGIDDIYNALSPLLAKYGLCILPRVLSRSFIERQTAKGGAIFYVTVEAEFDFVSSEDPNSKHTVKVYGEAMDSSDKATNKAMSAAYKYACLQAFSIPTEGSVDADQDHHEVVYDSSIFEKAKTAISFSNSETEIANHLKSAVSMFPQKKEELVKAATGRKNELLSMGEDK